MNSTTGTTGELGPHGPKLAPWYPEGRKFGNPGRCWELKFRDRLAWRIFRRLAHPAHAHIVWNHYRWGRDAMITTWSSASGNHSQAVARPPFEIHNLVHWMAAPICDKPGYGWSCSRGLGHDGPCAAWEQYVRIGPDEER